MKRLCIELDKDKMLVIKKEYKFYRLYVYYGDCADGFGKHHKKMTYISSYNSLADLEIDLGGLLLYIEYDEEGDIDDDREL